MIIVFRFWVLYRAKQDGPVVLGWRHPWDGHRDDHGHEH
ncbi:NADH dehydrogenase [ubiquinone] 1 beta subcomplex subunit 2 [Linum grandiflorum]